ncbi:MAG: pyrroline-5-carboxylate reductase [Planctomycetota bacterium]
MDRIGFIGAGQMASAIAQGISKSELPPVQFEISDPSDSACSHFESLVDPKCKVIRAESNQAVAECPILFLAVKPQYWVDAVDELKIPPTTIVVSIVAGVSVMQLELMLKTKKIVRTMPNTPCLIGKGACAIATSDDISPSERDRIESLFSCSGISVFVDENLIDSVTGVSGSGPAYVFTFIEALIDGGVLMGLSRQTSRQLAVQTVLGATEMLVDSGEHPAVLKDRVTSPGGTTIEALKIMEETGFRDSVMSAVQAATEKARELGEN